MRADALRNEADYLPADLGDLVELRRRLVAAGHPAHVVAGVIGWLVAKSAGDIDPTSAPTRSKYRKILAELELDDGPRRGRRLEVVSATTPGRRGERAPAPAAQNPRWRRYVKLQAAA